MKYVLLLCLLVTAGCATMAKISKMERYFDKIQPKVLRMGNVQKGETISTVVERSECGKEADDEFTEICLIMQAMGWERDLPGTQVSALNPCYTGHRYFYTKK